LKDREKRIKKSSLNCRVRVQFANPAFVSEIVEAWNMSKNKSGK
jgi:hypothetical protein